MVVSLLTELGHLEGEVIKQFLPNNMLLFANTEELLDMVLQDNQFIGVRKKDDTISWVPSHQILNVEIIP